MKLSAFLSFVCITFFMSLQGHCQQSTAMPSLATQLSQSAAAAEASLFEEKIWAYLEFAQVPSQDQKTQLNQAGVKLYQYRPDLRWLASFPPNIAPELLETCGVSRIRLGNEFNKVDQRLSQNRIPNYALSGSGVRATIVVAATGNYNTMLSHLESLGLSVQVGFAPLGFIAAKGSPTALLSAAQLPFVIYVELPEPPAELELEDEMTTTRGAYINGYYNLDGVNGDGITIAVNEGGRVDSIYNPDFRNRLDRSFESGNTSNHKTGVSLRMASAGNINPILRGQAWGADVLSGGINFTNAAAANVTIVSNSFGFGCISAGSTYNTGAATNDFLVRTNSRFMVTYSCGNIGASACSTYGAGSGWGNITGLTKSGKNIFAVGSMNTNDELTGFSSRGPAMDGRILPDITATGPGGTSHATPNLAGVNAMLTQAYRNVNGNQWPNSGLIKGIILNTADDIENEGPDYKSGFGRINARRAKEAIDNGQFFTNSVTNAGISTNTITVPANVKRLKITLYWNDREATPGITGKTLINDLDLRVQNPAMAWIQPWVLNPFPDPDSLNALAVRATDTLNNVEMVTIDNPAAGTYTAEVNGTLLPFGPQDYFIIYSFVYDSITVIYPRGGEGLVAGETRRIRWDAWDAGNTFDLEFSSDSGATWQSIATGLASELRSYTWTIPNTLTGNGWVKVKAGSMEAVSQQRFTIAPPPANLNMVWRCADSALFAWDTVSGASNYRVYRLGTKYMDTASSTANPYVMLHNLSATDSEWMSVQSVLPDGGSSRRAIAIEVPPGDFNCIGVDLALAQIESPQAGHYPDCFFSSPLGLTVILKNTGTTALTTLPIAYTLNGGAVQHDTLFQSLLSSVEATFSLPAALTLQIGSNTLKVWANHPGDGNAANDTLEIEITGYSGTSATLPYVQNFDSFTNCATTWGCASVTCNLTQGWYNLPNQMAGDSIDWRTHDGATGSGGTGPSGDHTSGSGKYLYLEGSGNGGGGCQNKEAQLHSPCFDLSGTNNPVLSYWYHANGGAIGELYVDVLADGEWHLDVAPPIIGQQGNQWLQQQANLSAYSGKKVVVRFRGRTGGGWQSDLALDDINLSSLPLAAFETVADTFCLGQPVALQNLSTYANAYNWSIQPGTFTYVSGSNTAQNPSILPSDTGWYDVQLIASNGSESDTLLAPDFFYVGGFTPTLVSNSPGDVFCAQSIATFTSGGGNANFHFYKNDTLEQSGAGNTWSTAMLNDGDTVVVEAVITAQCSFSSAPIVVSVQPSLEDTKLFSDDSDSTICEGDTVRFNAQPGLTNYVFYVNGSSQQVGPDSIWTTDQLQDGDFVEVEVLDSLGCGGFSNIITWTVLPAPPAPNILQLGGYDLQISTLADRYIWFLNGTLLTDSTQLIMGPGNGNYTAQIVVNGCISEPSQAVVIFLNVNEDLLKAGLRLFPNPTRENVNLLVEDTGYNRVQILDETGRLVLNQSIIVGNNSIQLDQLASGLYLVQISGEAGIQELKLVVE
ncbi:MAG: S8 family serine peptidase [Salibacteraceae bacterium]